MVQLLAVMKSGPLLLCWGYCVVFRLPLDTTALLSQSEGESDSGGEKQWTHKLILTVDTVALVISQTLVVNAQAPSMIFLTGG